MKQYSTTIYDHWNRKDETFTKCLNELVEGRVLRQTYPLEKTDIQDLEMYSGKKSLLQVAHKKTEQGTKYKQVSLFLNGNSKNKEKLEALVLGRRKK